MKCKTCSQSVTDAVVCGVCNGQFHYACIGVTETNYRKMNAERKAGIRCSQCRSSPESSGSQGISVVLDELKAFRSDFNSIQSQIQSIFSSIEAINTKWNVMETRLSDLEDRVVVLEGSAAIVSKLQSELEVRNEIIRNLQTEMNVRDQQARMNNVEISGIPFTKGENLVSIFSSICSKVGITIDANSVDSVHRVRRFVNKDAAREPRADDGGGDTAGASDDGSRPPAIIVKFTRRMCKHQLLAAMRARRGLTTADINLAGPASTIYVSDHLTPANKLLLKRARQRKAELQYAFLWTRDCKILMRKNETSKIIAITDDSVLLRLK